MQMTDVVNRRHMRHAHMVNITPEVMVQGMRADFNAVDRLSQAVLDKVRAASYVRATTPAGTDIRAELNPNYKWFKTSGIISTEKWGNLPGGECFTAARHAADHSHQPQPHYQRGVREQRAGTRVLELHAYG
jgi:leucyl aminopeptidase (aminopeptidase T)